MASLSIRIDLGPNVRVGPGKIRLLELIAEHGSISAAGRALGMSYRRAWLLVDELNHLFAEPVVAGQIGGRSGGGGAASSFRAFVQYEMHTVQWRNLQQKWRLVQDTPIIPSALRGPFCPLLHIHDRLCSSVARPDRKLARDIERSLGIHTHREAGAARLDHAARSPERPLPARGIDDGLRPPRQPQ